MGSKGQPPPRDHDELRPIRLSLPTTLLQSHSRWVIAIAAFSAAETLLALASSAFMLLLFDSVLPRESKEALIALSLLAAAAFLTLAALDHIRRRMTRRLGAAVTADLSDLTLAADAKHHPRTLRNLDQIQSFMQGNAPLALIDAPWIALYLMAIAALSQELAAVAVVLIALQLAAAPLFARLSRVWTNRSRREREDRDRLFAGTRQTRTSAASRAAAERIRSAAARQNHSELAAADAADTCRSLSHLLRQATQALVIAIGGALVIDDALTAGGLLACSLLLARTIASVEGLASSWEAITTAKRAASRLGDMLERNAACASPEIAPSALPPSLACENLSLVAPHGALVLRSLSLNLTIGQSLGIVGPSGAGKSTLLRAIAGETDGLSMLGTIRVNGQGSPNAIGYLPQNPTLPSGTIAEIISSFEETNAAARVTKAANAIALDDDIERLPHGYRTRVTAADPLLSAGQRQKLAIARAFYADPNILLLDDPTTFLDQQGERALATALDDCRARGAIVILITHKLGALSAMNDLLVLQNGRCVMTGPRQAVLDALTSTQLQRDDQAASTTLARDTIKPRKFAP